jgi:streptogramin lyase
MRIHRASIALLMAFVFGTTGAGQRVGEIVDVAIRRWNAGGVVGGIAVAPDGHVWFSLPAAVAIGRLDPATGVIRTYPLNGGVPSTIQVGKDGSIWFVPGEAGWISRLNERNGKVDRIAIDGTAIVTKLAVAPNGNVWFAGPRLGLLNARTLTASYPVDVGQSVMNIAATPQGSVFFIEVGSHTIDEIDQRLLHVASNVLPPSFRLDTISTAAAGAALFTDAQRGFVGVVNNGTGWQEISIRPPGTNNRVFGVSAGRDGYLWAGVMMAEGLAVLRLNSSILNPSLEDRGRPRTQRFMITQGPVPQPAMIAGNGSELWFISEGSPVITRVIGITAAERR